MGAKFLWIRKLMLDIRSRMRYNIIVAGRNTAERRKNEAVR